MRSLDEFGRHAVALEKKIFECSLFRGPSFDQYPWVLFAKLV